ncbi:PRC-barrel domain-containing protein [Acidimicrobiia bacterium EGI L10123]|uniref:PRC-barrel domain-containing protein n=1 Tax=Salinilacustrithrix flava TaxID=2957203 RepID=UPI003D7C3404|nr:PRC-barrel domain-containing protein [Acidimicrobiia bacterium EGI L10123]
MTITGKRLLSSSGEDIGEVKDVVGLGADGPGWVAVKTGLLSQRLVPFSRIDQTGDQLRTDLDVDDIKSAPKVPTHVEPVGEDLDLLRAHYGAGTPAAPDDRTRRHV